MPSGASISSALAVITALRVFVRLCLTEVDLPVKCLLAYTHDVRLASAIFRASASVSSCKRSGRDDAVDEAPR